MDRKTGRALDNVDHLSQSVGDILTTLIGTRVMRRDYGSLVPLAVDAPLNPRMLAQLNAWAIDALSRWEPRLKIVRLSWRKVGASLILNISGSLKQSGKHVDLELLI